MRFFLIFILFFSCNNNEFDSKENFIKNVNNLDRNKIYLVFRETDSKNGFVSKNYNITSSSMSHVGIGFFNSNDVFKVFHIDLKSNDDDKNNDVMISGINDFFYLNDCDVLAGEIWEFENEFSRSEFSEMFIYMDSVSNVKDLKFDIDFNYANSTKLYCSELVSKFLVEFSNDYAPVLKNVKLKKIHELYINKKNVDCIPVDYFMTLSNFKRKMYFKKEA